MSCHPSGPISSIQAMSEHVDAQSLRDMRERYEKSLAYYENLDRLVGIAPSHPGFRAAREVLALIGEVERLRG